MARQYSPNEVRYLIDNYLLPPRILGRHLGRSPQGVSMMIKRLKEHGRIIEQKPKPRTKIEYQWIIQK